MKHAAWFVPVVLSAFALGLAQPASPPSSRPGADPPAVGATDPLKSLAFLTGTWSGTMEGDPVEETWSAPRGDSIIGMFRWQHEGQTTLFELLAIKNEQGTPVLRLRHFGPDFGPWKGECDAVAAMKATTIEPNRVVFTNSSDVGGVGTCEYAVSDGKTLSITVAFRPDRRRDPLKFALTKAP